MRKIKFRIWYCKEKLMGGNMGILNLPNIDDIKERINLLQYAGFKDENGKEVYKEDIIEYNISVPFDKKSDLKFKHVVSYSELNHWWYLEFFRQKFKREWIDGIKDFEGKGQALGKYFRIKIIGNIYENPELLKGGKQ